MFFSPFSHNFEKKKEKSHALLKPTIIPSKQIKTKQTKTNFEYCVMCQLLVLSMKSVLNDI